MFRPSHFKPKNLKICTFDIETDYPDNPEDVILIGFYDGEKYYEFDNFDSFLGQSLKSKYYNNAIYAHNGGRFDFKFLLDSLSNYNYDYEILDVGGSILNIRIPFHKIVKTNGEIRFKYNINYRDSYALLKDSLHKITHSFKVPHRKKEANFFKPDEKDYIDKYKNWELFREYLEYDTIGLYEAIRHFEDIIHRYNGNIKLTIASTSINIFKNNYLKTNIFPINKNIQIGEMLGKPVILNIEDEIRNNYVGGRTEIFKRSGENLFYYDVNSLYPWVMHENKFPISNPVFATAEQITKNDVGFFQCNISYPECPHGIPLLPKKIFGKHYNKLIYPVGKWSGLYHSDMIKYAIKEGYDIEVLYGFIFDYEYLFKDFVNDMYSLRKENESYKLIFKYILNSLYGKFAQKRTTKQIIRVLDEDLFNLYQDVKPYIDELGLYEIEKIIDSNHIIPSISNTVTQMSQLEIYTWYKKAGFDVYNTDTDSFVTHKKMAHSKRLGDIKLEYEIEEAIFLFPKFYYFNGFDVEENKPVAIKKMKGFSKGIDNITYKDFFNALHYSDYSAFDLEYIDLWGYKESLRRKKQFMKYGLKRKSIKSDYNKRYVMEDNINTQPIRIENEIIIG